VLALGVVELQGAGHGVEDIVGHAADVALLQAVVPVGADPGQHGDLLAAQPGHPPAPGGRQPDLGGGELGAAGGQEVANLGAVVHGIHVTGGSRFREVELVPPITRPPTPARTAVSWMM
jgi:hypothetical protein